MSVEALAQVFGDRSQVPGPVQAVLVALAWRTPKGGDSTYPVSYRDLSNLTHLSPSAVGRAVRRAIDLGAVEVVWARDGQPGKYRVNRGDWHVPGPVDKPVGKPVETDQTQFDLTPDPGQSDTGTGGDMTPGVGQSATPYRNRSKEEDRSDLPPSLARLHDRLVAQGRL